MPQDKYHTHVEPRLQEIEAWCRDGLSDKQIAQNCGIAESTFSRYKLLHKELKECLVRTKNIVDNVIVVNAYFKRAIGYTAVEVRREYVYIKDEETGKVERVLAKEIEQDRHVPGDPRAMENWLALRQGETWGALHPGTRNLNADDDSGTGIVLLPERRKETADEQ